uniref:C2 domain-containing protein n=1 Tax=Rodentolepis nana TaxID=102285 RepID=A0A0R3TF07_RODNA
LPENERPFTIRQLEGWYYINRIPSIRPFYGILEIGLIHDPNLGKITVSIIKGKQMLAPDNSFMEITVSVQKKTRICKKQSPLEAISSIRSGGTKFRGTPNSINDTKTEPVVITERPGKIYVTSVRSETSEPVWDDRFTFNVQKEQLQNVMFDILVYHKERVIGGLRIGRAVSYLASQQWTKMIKRPGVWAYSSYILQ